MVESLSRSRQKWLNEGLFEKYWTKPHKRKGVLVEEPNNPPKDSMTKVGTVTIAIEPHIIEATMYTVKDPKSKPQLPPPPAYTQSRLQPKPQSKPSAPLSRPILQYGPPQGVVPPRQAASPAHSGAQKPAMASPLPASAQPISRPASASPAPPVKPGLQTPLAAAASPSLHDWSVRPPQGFPPSGPPQPSPSPTPAPVAQMSRASPATALPAAPPPAPVAAKPPTPGGAPAKPATKPVANDPVITLLAKRASGDAQLRDLMKRVAMGQAKEGELAHFQKIIDQLSGEYKRSGGQQGPSADRLLVDGRTVKYFADEVRAIVDIVLASNPSQRSADLKPPARSDPLVVLLVKSALDSNSVKQMIKRIATNTPGFTDAQDLKELLDKLNKDAKAAAKPPPIAAPPAKPPTPNGVQNGHVPITSSPMAAPANSQSLRSKGPPPVPRPDIASVVFDFGTGDRYLFPKFSILEAIPMPGAGQQIVASFLIVRKGSTSEYQSDPDLDYYQPITIRLITTSGRYLDNLSRVVAPLEEVRRYMDDVMDTMTRAEYILLAMRLPRPTKDSPDEDVTQTNGVPKSIEETPDSKPSVLWTTEAPREEDMSWQRQSAIDAEDSIFNDLLRSATKNVERINSV